MTDSSLSRRAFLGTAAAVGSTGLAGCSAFSGEAELRIVSLRFTNFDDRAHTFEATITESDEVRFEERVEVGPAEYEDGEPVAVAFHEASDHPTDPGAYVLEATVDDGEPRVLRMPELADGGATCVTPDIRATEDGAAEIRHSTWCD
jgi:uncharacterized DUF497 family protein